jgi:FixJ family two-component response regulator
VPDQPPGLGQELRDVTRETGIQVKRLPAPDGSLNAIESMTPALGCGRELDVPTTVKAMRGGASEFLSKPIAERQSAVTCRTTNLHRKSGGKLTTASC